MEISCNYHPPDHRCGKQKWESGYQYLPTATGEWDPVSESILLEVGDWLNTNGDSIYGAGESPTAKPSWGRCTLKGNTLYLHVFNLKKRNKLIVPGLKTAVQKVFALDGGEELFFTKLSEQDLEVELPSLPNFAENSNNMPLVIAIVCAEPVEGNPVRLLDFGEDTLLELGVFESEIFGPTLRYDTGKKTMIICWTGRIERIPQFGMSGH